MIDEAETGWGLFAEGWSRKRPLYKVANGEQELSELGASS